MPRAMAPPPSNEFSVKLTKPFSGSPSHIIEVIGELHRPASIKDIHYDQKHSHTEKVGDVPTDDVQELLRLVTELRGFPSHPSEDIYGQDVKVDFNTFDIQWSNEDEDTSDSVKEIAGEEKDDFKRIAQSIEALARWADPFPWSGGMIVLTCA
ncbi:hypothetical protein LTR53_013132 [Teratosphaeriaceae sp. CCFEE 6253]|nr:hypothetical protein LTR53_013132 [Teratosphaeriaceae sp. CCFEE 6253]